MKRNLCRADYNKKEQTKLIQEQRKKYNLPTKINYKDLDLDKLKEYIINNNPTNFDIMQEFNISYKSFYKWIGNSKGSRPDFKYIIDSSRDIIREKFNKRIEDNLIKRALGCKVKKTTTEIITDSSNNIIRQVVREVEEELAPDVKAIEFYLKANIDKYYSKNTIDIDINNNQNEYSINILQVGDIIEADRDDSTIQKVVDYSEEV